MTAHLGTCFLVFFIFLHNAFLLSQEPDENTKPERSIVPYQRVFLPLELVGQLTDQLRNYDLLGRPEWEQLFNPFLVDDETAKIFDRPPEISHVYLSARLDGSNLVSNSSRIRFTRGSLTAESYRLEPWSLAINTSRPGESSAASRIARPGNDGVWGHDRNGTPVINLHRSTVESAVQPLDVVFPWTLRSLAASKPTNLQFSFSFPRVSDSCLVLSLPKQATIVDADAAVTKIEDWSSESKRLGEWGEQADLELNRANLASDARWLIELSGVDRCRFTISFDEASGVGTSAINSLDYLVLEHITEHDLNRFAITSSTKLEVSGDRNLWDRPFKFQLPVTSRIRSLTVAGREVGWRSQDGMIVVLADDLRRIPATRESTTTVKISYLTLLGDIDSSKANSVVEAEVPVEIGPTKLVLPLMQLDKSFVIKGLTTVRRALDVQFSKIDTSAKLRPFEKDHETTWEWSGYGPDFGIEIGPSSSKREIRAVTKVSTQGDEPKIMVRIMVPGSQRFPLALELPKSWKNISVVPGVNSTTNASTPSTWSVIKDLQSSTNRFYIYGGAVESVGTLDLQVQHVANDSLSQMDFDANWLMVEGKTVPNKLIVESLPADWEILGLRSSDVLAINQLLPDEKSFATAPDAAVVCLIKNYALSLVKTKPRQSARASMSASLKRVGETLVRAEYHMKVDSNSSSNSIRVKYDLNKANVVTLRLLDKQGELIKSDAQWGYSDLDQSFDIAKIEPNETIVITADLSIEGGKVGIPVPRIVGAGSSSLELKVDPSLAIADTTEGVWEYRNDGELIVSIPSETESIGVVAENGMLDPRSLADESIAAHYDLTVDGQGISRAFWVLKLSPALDKEYRFTVDEGWDFELKNNEFSFEECTAWIDRKSEKPELCIRASSALSRENAAKIEFVTRRRASLATPEGLQPLIVRAPRLYDGGGQPIDSKGAVWFPKGTGWKPRKTDSHSFGISSFPVFKSHIWVWRPWDGLIHSENSSSMESVGERQVNESTEVLANSWLSETNLDVGWEKLMDIKSVDEESSIVVVDVSKLKKLQVFSFCIGIFLGAIIVRWSKWGFCFYFIILFSIIALIRTSNAEYILAIADGQVWGGLLGATLWQIRKAIVRDPMTPIRPSTNSTIWEIGKGGRSDSLIRVVFVLVGAGLAFGFSKNVHAQDSAASSSDSVPSIFIPFDSKEVDKVDQVLVPEDLIKRIRGNPGTPYTLKSSRHQLKLSSRGMTVEGVDQLVSIYEVYVNEPGAAIEIPFKPSLQNFSRLLVDGREVTIVPALVSQREFLTWTADREGLRIITVYQVPRWVSRPAATVGTISLDSREVDLSILPASNAILEVDSDPTVVFDVESQGAVLDKESGRYVVHLGAMPSIRGKVRYEPSTTAAMATRSQSDLTFDIDLLLQSKTVLARTVLKAVAGSSLDKRLTIEADKMWEPVGANWGNYRLVETRNGRLQYLRRYVFELATTGTERAETESIIYWALADKKATEARLLFAECVEPVLRPRTLRYARVFRSEWNIEQITNWIPAISETESLNWPDLKLIKADQRATSLRVPQTGGGSLTRSIAGKSLQARIASRWVIESDKQLLTSRIEFFGTSNTDLLELELPNGFSVDEVTNRNANAKVKVNEREENGIRYAQLVAERINWENYDFAIRLVKRDLSIETSMPIPWLGVFGSQIMEQSVEVAASKVWRVELVSASATERILLGQGEETGLATLMPGDQIRLIPRSPTAKGELSVSQRGAQTEGRVEVVVAGDFEVPKDSVAVAIFEIPQLLNNRWRSDVQVLPAPCPIVNKSWLKIPLDRRTDAAESTQFELSFSLTLEEFNQFQASADWLRLVNPSEIDVSESLSDLLVQLGLEVPGSSLSPPSDSGHYFYVNNGAGTSPSGARFIRYWFDSAGKSLQVKLAPKSDVNMVRWNGKRVGWSQDSEHVTIQLPACPVGQWNEIEISLAPIESSSGEVDPLFFEVVGKKVPVYEIGAADSSDSDLPSRLENFARAVKAISTVMESHMGENVVVGSAAAVHSEFWVRRLLEMSQQFGNVLSGSGQDKLVESRSRIDAALNRLPKDVDLAMSENVELIPRVVETEATQWNAMAGSLFVVILTMGVLLFTNSKRFPLVTLVLAGGAVWLLTGLWPIFAFILVVVAVVAIDMIWINRLNRRLVR
ncbi:MAG: hypothetical protein ACK5YR_16135 [Pirellula sp.]|jgi:hypothetical protein